MPAFDGFIADAAAAASPPYALCFAAQIEGRHWHAAGYCRQAGDIFADSRLPPCRRIQ